MRHVCILTVIPNLAAGVGFSIVLFASLSATLRLLADTFKSLLLPYLLWLAPVKPPLDR